MRKYHLSNQFILLFKERLQHIQIKGQHFNCNLKKVFIKIHVFDYVMYSANLANALNFLDAF